MPNLTSTEQSHEERERRAERALGALGNEVKHLTATIQGLKDDQRGIKQKLEAIERDLSATPKVPRDVLAAFSASIAQLTLRLERLEATVTDKEETKPPKRSDDDRKSRREAKDDERRQGQPEHRQSPTSLDSWF